MRNNHSPAILPRSRWVHFLSILLVQFFGLTAESVGPREIPKPSDYDRGSVPSRGGRRSDGSARRRRDGEGVEKSGRGREQDRSGGRGRNVFRRQ